LWIRRTFEHLHEYEMERIEGLNDLNFLNDLNLFAVRKAAVL